MSNHPEIEFNKTMQEYLLKNALPFDLNNEENYILNSGKHIVYSGNNTYIKIYKGKLYMKKSSNI